MKSKSKNKYYSKIAKSLLFRHRFSPKPLLLSDACILNLRKHLLSSSETSAFTAVPILMIAFHNKSVWKCLFFLSPHISICQISTIIT